MPDAHGNFKPIRVPADAWERIFGRRCWCGCHNALPPDRPNAIYCSHACAMRGRKANSDNRPTDK